MRPTFILLTFFLLTSLGYAQEPALTYDHQAILVSNLERSSQFYTQSLGLKEIENKPLQPHIRWYAMGSGKQLHIIEDSQISVPPVKGLHMAFSSDNLNNLIAHLKTLDIYFENWMGEPFTTNTRPDGIRQIYLQDPDGYWIEINGK